MKKTLILICTAIFLFAGRSNANLPSNVSFSHISINEGLSQSTVFDIVQDNGSCLWFATYDGLNKYNGYNFTVYRHDPQEPNSISSDIIRALYIDSKDRLWIGTRLGLSVYNSEKETFTNYYTQSKNNSKLQVSEIIEFDTDMLLLATSTGVVLFDVRNEAFIPAPGIENNEFVATTFIHVDDEIWIGLNNGLIIYNKKTRKVTRSVDALKGVIVQTVLREADDRIWVATEGAGLYMIDDKRGIVKSYKHNPNDKNSICSDFIRSLSLDHNGRLWVGTFNGLNIYDKRYDNFAGYKNNPIDESSISQNSIRSIFRDSQGGMWCGTYFGGLNYYHSLNNRFGHMKFIPNMNTLNDNVVSCIVEDKENNLWIGTNDRGVNFYNAKTGRFTYFMNSQNYDRGIESNNVKTIYVDDANDLIYIGTHAGGLNVLNRKSNIIRHFNTQNSSINDNNVYSILKGGPDFFWIGTLKGVMRYYPSDGRFVDESDELSNIFVSQLYLDSKKRLWIGQENGILVYSPEEKKLLNIELITENISLKNAFINCIHESQKGELCFGTRSGLFICSEKDQTLLHYTTKNGLPNNVVYGILEDNLQRLWLSTNKGLVYYTPYSKEFRVYSQTDGIQSDQFNSYSYCKTKDGLMYFGGINGITVFQPEKLVDNPYAPLSVIDKLYLFNKEVKPDDETGILSRSISKTNSIELRSNQTSFSLEFVVSNYVSGKNNTFSYKLDGFDNEWLTLTNGNRMITYTNLDQGTYTLRVRVANNDGIWSKNITELKIVVLPVWWKTWWAILLFTVLIIAIAVIVTRTIWFRKMLKKELRMEQLDKKRQEDMNQMKTRFFINLSHELRTPLTLIQSPLQELMTRSGSDRWTQNQLQHIQKNTNKLMHIINQLMDYRRTELGVFELKVIENNLQDFVYDNFMLYEGLAKRKRIDYFFESEIEGQQALFSPQYLELIINNLLSNAFKFTNDGGVITMRLKRMGEEILLEIEDNGRGIPANQHEKIFDRFYQVNPDHTGSGIGLSLIKSLIDLHHGRIELESEVGKGSCFRIYIPQNRAVYAASEFAADGQIEPSKHTEVLESLSYLHNELDDDEPDMEAKKGTVLIVEDNLEILDYLKTELKKLYNVITVEDGIPALEILKDEDVDLVITDVMLPEMSGIKLCRAIKQNIRTCHIPVIMLSAKANVNDQLEGLEVGADDYITKPFSISVLLSKVYNTLRSRKRMLDHYSNSLEVEPEKITFNAMDEELIRKATDIVRKNMDNIEFSADEFSREMAMSRSNLHLKLKAITGESTIEFIRKIRFNEACKLLKDGRYSVAEVSVMVGFNSSSYFATSFKKYFGFLPTEYVKNLRK